jgi:hypothetical protein
MLSGPVLLLVASTWHLAPAFTQVPAGAPAYNVNAKWFADRGSQLYNVKAYGAKCDGVSDDSAALAAAVAAITAGGGTLFIPPCATPYNLASARLAITTSNVLVSGYGATLLCTVSDDCVTLGNLSNPNAAINDAIKGLIIEPGVGSAGHSAIRDNAQVGLIEDVRFVYNGGNNFNHLIENDDDQAEVVKHPIVEVAGVVRCDSTFCGSALWGPGPFSTNAGITWLYDPIFNMGCSGNAIEWQNGNDLHVSGGVIQGFNQYALRIGPTSYTNDVLKGVHIEQGSCSNPLGNLGSAGLIAIDTTVYNFGGSIGGGLPEFPQAGTTGSTHYSVYVVGHNPSGGAATPPMAAGWLTNGNAVINATNNITDTWYDFAGAGGSYDVLRYQSTLPRTAPFGTGNWAVATGLAESSVCTGGVCTFVDTVTSPSSYAVPGFGGWTPQISLWPGALVLSPNVGCTAPARYYGDSLGQGSTITNLCGSTPGTVIMTVGQVDFSGDWIPFGPSFVTMLGLPDPSSGKFGALVLPGSSGSKGELNMSGSSAPTDIETYQDSNPAKTYSTASEHPSYDVGDTAACLDLTGFCFRSPTSISQYLNSLPDDVSWLERVTPTLKMFTVPLGSFSVAQINNLPNYHAVSDVTRGGTLSPNTQYCYRISSLDNLGEVVPDPEHCVTTANDGNSTHQVQMYWAYVVGATRGYRIYGRASGSEQLLTTIPNMRYPQNPPYVLWNDTGALTPRGAMPTSNTTGQVKAALYSTATNCSSSASPALCGSAAAGSVVIAPGATSVVVDTSAVTANSQIMLTEDSSLGRKLGVTCNTRSLLVLGTPRVTARSAGTSFTATIEVGPTTNPLCISYAIFNQ